MGQKIGKPLLFGNSLEFAEGEIENLLKIIALKCIEKDCTSSVCNFRYLHVNAIYTCGYSCEFLFEGNLENFWVASFALRFFLQGSDDIKK